MKKSTILIFIAIAEISLFYCYSLVVEPKVSFCSEIEDGDRVKLYGVVEERSERSFLFNDGTGKIVVLNDITFERGVPLWVEGRVFERSGQFFLDCDKAEVRDQEDCEIVTLEEISENPQSFLSKKISVYGKVKRNSHYWFSLEDHGREIIVLTGGNVSVEKGERINVSGALFFDNKDFRYKMRAESVQHVP